MILSVLLTAMFAINTYPAESLAEIGIPQHAGAIAATKTKRVDWWMKKHNEQIALKDKMKNNPCESRNLWNNEKYKSVQEQLYLQLEKRTPKIIGPKSERLGIY